jgi:hypothetical protein
MQLLHGAGVRDRRLDLAAVADDAGIGEEPLDLTLAERGDGIDVEPGEARTERGALAQDRDPRQPRLEAFEAQQLEQLVLVVLWPTPLVIVVRDVVRVRARP